MSRRRFLPIVLASILSLAVFGAEKQRDWQTGKVLDSQRSRYFAGTVGSSSTTGNAEVYGNSGTYRGQTNDSQAAVYRVFETFLIEGDKYAYLAQESLRWRWSKPANITINGPVKYVIEKRKLFVLDEDGKEQRWQSSRRLCDFLTNL
jgi:hypothetical protein